MEEMNTGSCLGAVIENAEIEEITCEKSLKVTEQLGAKWNE